MTISKEDAATIASLQAEYAKRKKQGDNQDDLDALHAGAEGIRAKYGISGGVDGSQYIPISNSTDGTLKSANSQDDYINQLYAAKKNYALAQLKTAYEQNTADLDNTAAQIPNTYNTARNQAASASAVNQAAFNERAAASGLNSGTGAQAALSMGNTLQSNLSSVDSAQASKLADIDTQRSKIASAYNSAIQQAVADNDSERAQALYNEAVRLDNSLISQSQAQTQLDLQKQEAQASQKKYSDEQALAKAQALAAIGDYSGYESLYGLSAEDAEKYYKLWRQQNPKAATAIYG